MRIGGEVALALPEAECSTVWLEMSDDEKLLYQMHCCADGHGFTLDDITRFQACAHLYDKHVVCGIKLDPRRRTDERIAKLTSDAAAATAGAASAAASSSDPPAAATASKGPSLDSPLQLAGFPAATAAFLRLHEKCIVQPPKITKQEQRKIDNCYGDAEAALGKSRFVPSVKWSSSAKLTKFATLIADLKALREVEPEMKVPPPHTHTHARSA